MAFASRSGRTSLVMLLEYEVYSGTFNMLLKQPIIHSGIDRASRAAVCIDLLHTSASGEERQIGSGTGFVHRHSDRDYLITNWHVVTGRNPEDASHLLPGYAVSPSEIRLHLPSSDDPNHFRPSASFSLYDGGRPNWFQTEFEHTKSRADLIAIPFDFGDEPLVVRIDEFSGPHDQILRAGRDVVIVGYPFGIQAANPFPTWKRGYVASEPSILIAGLPKYYIDTPGRPGMSGSPVFMIGQGKGVSKEMHDLLHQFDASKSALDILRKLDVDEFIGAPDVNMLQFAGVYSGVAGDGHLSNMNLGVTWHAAMVDRLFSHTSNGGKSISAMTRRYSLQVIEFVAGTL